MACEPRWITGNHPTPEQLLLTREDELPREEAEAILAHIHQCWECRTRVERYKRGIDAYMNFRKLHLDPPVMPSPGGWLRFAARLRDTGREQERSPEPLWRRVPRSVWLGFPALAAAAVLALVLMVSPARLTATAVLERAMRAEAAGEARPAVQRVLEIHALWRAAEPDEPRELLLSEFQRLQPADASGVGIVR